MRQGIRMAVIAFGILTVAAGTWLALGESVRAQTAKTIAEATLEEPNQKTPEVSTDELRGILANHSAVVFDARPPKEYAISHSPGAINVNGKAGRPMSQYTPDASEIIHALGRNKTMPVVLYCSGPFCGRSKRLSQELLAAGVTNVRRYQLGIPVWRALGGSTQIELGAVAYVHELDHSAVFVDARDPKEFHEGSIPRAVSVPASQLERERGKDVGEIRRAKDDGRLPMEDHNTRVVVFGHDGEQARAVAEAIIGEAFHNVAFYDGTFETLRKRVKSSSRSFIIGWD
jgi:rhodanese-related sulfurtransferase